MKRLKKLLTLALILLLTLSIPVLARADQVELEYKLTLTDQNGREVLNPRELNAGDTLYVEIELSRKDSDASSYGTYGLEFRLLTRGLSYNGDGASFRNGTPITKQVFLSGDSVGFAYYDDARTGEAINNPVLAGQWSYTVTDPAALNITVPVALMYLVDDSESYEPVGNARLFLDPTGGEIIGTDVSGLYPSGTVVSLPEARFADYRFLGWSDGVRLYDAGSRFVVTGVVTLTAMWEGLMRDRRVLFEANGGTILGDDPSGMYADGEVVVVPDAKRDGYHLNGWTMEGETYAAGDEYVVDNSVIFFAGWTEAVPAPDTQEEARERTLAAAVIVPAAAALLGLLFLLLWKRRWVLYSLKNGDVALSYKEKKHDYLVEVILFAENEDGSRSEYRLNKSNRIEAKHRLRFIQGQESLYPIVPVEKGKYKGKLMITDPQGKTTEKKARIKVLDREIRKRDNR